MSLTEKDRQQLDAEGYLVLPGFMSAELLERLRSEVERLFAEEGESAGSEFKMEPGCRRLANLVNKGLVFQELVAMPEILNHVRQVLGPEIKLSSCNARSVNPHSAEAQPLHADMGAIADEKGYWVCNTVWMLDDYREDNGALRVVPGSHRWRQLPQQVLANCLDTHPEQVMVTGKAGTVVVMNAHLWHGGLGNQTDHPRTAVHAFYCRRDKPQQQYQKALLRPQVQQVLSDQLRHLLALDDPLNDQISAEVATRSGFLR